MRGATRGEYCATVIVKLVKKLDFARFVEPPARQAVSYDTLRVVSYER